MEKKIHVEMTECDCQFPNLEDASPKEIRDAQRWWEAVGQHSSYHRARLIDTRFDEPMTLCVQSPYYTRGDEDAKGKVKTMLEEAVKDAIQHRLAQCPDPT